MTDNPPTMASDASRGSVSDAAKEKAKELIGGVIATYAEQHANVASFIQQVSDAAKQVRNCPPSAFPGGEMVSSILAPFILPEPVDPLVDVVTTMRAEDVDNPSPEMTAARLRAELAKRGYSIVETSHDK